jgi:hypothetical protein
LYFSARSEDFPGVVPGDVIEIYHEDETFPRLLLQVNSMGLLMTFTNGRDFAYFII